MCPNSNERDADDENYEEEASYIRKVSELEASLKRMSKLEERYIKQLKYARADLENLQKNTQRRIEETVTKEKERLIMQIIVVAEEMDLAVEEARKLPNSNILAAIEMLRRKLWNVLTNEGLCAIESLGKPFDPHLHEAVLEIETLDHPEGTVMEEVKKGYLFRGNLLKPSMVKVATIPDSNDPGMNLK
jgi:molecular chaperone GrpE